MYFLKYHSLLLLLCLEAIAGIQNTVKQDVWFVSPESIAGMGKVENQVCLVITIEKEFV